MSMPLRQKKDATSFAKNLPRKMYLHRPSTTPLPSMLSWTTIGLDSRVCRVHFLPKRTPGLSPRQIFVCPIFSNVCCDSHGLKLFTSLQTTGLQGAHALRQRAKKSLWANLRVSVHVHEIQYFVLV
jgi:hypothetical protein